MQMPAIAVGPEGSPLVLRACLVDQHEGVRAWLTGVLGALGVDVCGASDTVAGGIAAIAAHHPDLVVVDSRLPDGRGVELCRAVSARFPEVGLILHTAVVTAPEEAEAYDAGVTRIALKSIQGDDLRAAVAELAARPRLL